MKVKEFLKGLEVTCEVVYFYDNARMSDEVGEQRFSCTALDTSFTYEEVDEMEVHSIGVLHSNAIRLDIMD